MCRKTRIWKQHTPAEAFRLVRGGDRVSRYRFADAGIDHTFCATCGVHVFATSSESLMGGDFVCVNIAFLDDVSPEECAAAPLRYEDGAHDWASAAQIASYP